MKLDHLFINCEQRNKNTNSHFHKIEKKTKMANFEETQFESNDNNPFRRDDMPINMINFGKKSQLVMGNFKKCCEEIKFDNSEIMTCMVFLIKEQRKIFRKFAESSIKFSDKLLDYSIDLLFFVDCFKDKRYSDDECLELLNDLLIKSKENSRLIKDLKKMIINKVEIENTGTTFEDIISNKSRDTGINEKLTLIQSFLPKYAEVIKKHPSLIDSDKVSKIEQEKTLRKIHLEHGFASSVIGLVFCVGAGLFTLGAGAPVAAAAATVTVSDVLLSISAGSNLYSAVKLVKVKGKDKAINDLGKKLKIEADELIEKVKLFSKSLESIILEINMFEIFWETQIERIDYLIKNLKGFKKTEKRHFKAKIINSIEKRWKDVERECQIYSHEMKDLLIRDGYTKVKF
jgi:hypothetical protein